MSEYPIVLRFDLTVGSPIRRQVLTAAKYMGLTVDLVDERGFEVRVRSAAEAYNFGAKSMTCVYDATEDVEPTRAIRTRRIELE